MNAPAVGIDIGESESVAHFVSASGDTLEHFSFKMNDAGFNEFRKKIPVNARIAFEASGLAYPVFKKLKNLEYEDITVAHPKELSWIIKSKKKNDHVDSIKLAKLHLVDMLPKSNLLDPEEQIFRDLLVQRVKIGQQISNLKNCIIGYLKREDLFNKLPE
ncbi:MAG: IS110 family transposase [Thermoplasmata archaeon]